MSEDQIKRYALLLRGRNGKLRPSKPDGDGITTYLWRMARFHAGYDTRMPIMCAFELQDELKRLGLKASVAPLINDEGRRILDHLDNAVDRILGALGENPMRGSMVWGRALGAL